MNFKKILCCVFLFICYLGFSFSQDDEQELYHIGPKDLLIVNVFEVPELKDLKRRVTEDGTVNLPLLGKVKVSGLTQFELERKLVGLLEKSYLKNAQVTIFIEQYASKQVSIMGAIKNPGSYDLVGRQTLLDIISKAGGLSDNASRKAIVIRSYKGNRSTHLDIDLHDLMIKGMAKYNIPLQAGDVINIPQETFLDIYVMGRVKNPGHLKLKDDGEITLLKAIAQAGGFDDRARKGSVVVKRRVDGKEKQMKVNVKKILSGKKPDFILKHNDIVYVPESVL